MGEHSDSNVRRRVKNGSICVIHQNRVYDVTDFADRHPGGKQILKDYSGGDVTYLMQSSVQHIHSRAAYSMLQQYDVGPVSNGNTKISDADYKYNNNKPILEDNLVDWNKPILHQITELGEKYYEWVHQPVDRQFRMFYSDFMEFFSKSKWWYIPIFWIPVIYKLLWNSFNTLSSEPASWPRVHPLIEFNQYHVPFLVFCGIILWTLLEYGLHRWLFHRKPPSDSPL